jgi:hypothetical protein
LLLFTSGQGRSWADRMVQFVPTGVFDFPFTVNNLPLELDLVSALLPQVHVVSLSPSRVERRSCHCECSPARGAARVDPIVARW